MNDKQIDPGHSSTRRALRIIGPLVALVGLGFLVMGMAGFFRAFGGFEPPQHMWCSFVGMPLLFVGLVMTSYGYMGKVMRYGAQETAPVMKDTFNYMADGTQEAIKTVAGAIGKGLREGGYGTSSQVAVRCHKCNALLAPEAKFCSQCGQAVAKTKPCPQCAELNDRDA